MGVGVGGGRGRGRVRGEGENSQKKIRGGGRRFGGFRVGGVRDLEGRGSDGGRSGWWGVRLDVNAMLGVGGDVGYGGVNQE